MILQLLLTGCVQYQWVNPSRPTANLNADSVSCEQRVASLYPTQNVMVQTGGGSDAIFTKGYKYVFGMFPRATRQFAATAAKRPLSRRISPRSPL